MIAVLRRLTRRFPWLLHIAIGGVRLVAFAVALVETPIFLLRHRRLFRNSIGCVYWVWSFGHYVFGLDYMSRLYHPHRVSLVFIPDPRANPYFAFCFEHNVDVFVFRSVLAPLLERLDRRLNFVTVRRTQYRVVRFWLLAVSALSSRFTVIDHPTTVYKTLSVLPDGMWIGRAAPGDLVRTDDVTGYVRLLRDGVGQSPRMPARLRERCVQAITAGHPRFFDRPFVTLLLRLRERNSPDFSDAIRCSGPQENYVAAVRHLIERGYHVVGAGETDHAVFAGLPGYFSLADIELPPKLLNLFVLMHCALYIGQASGPNWMGSMVGYPSLVCDGVWYSGTFRPTDLILYKPYYEGDTGRRLSVVEVFRDHTDLVFGYNYAWKRIEIGHNSSDEILEGVKETLAVLEGRFVLSDDDRRLCERYAKLLPPRAVIAAQGNRPPLYVLRQHEKELLDEA